MENNDIKALTPSECPHCGGSIIIESTVTAPKVTGIYTLDMIKAAKTDALKRISDLHSLESVTKSAIDWINDPETIFSPNDVDEIIKNIPKPI